jgi:hypothetical protein
MCSREDHPPYDDAYEDRLARDRISAFPVAEDLLRTRLDQYAADGHGATNDPSCPDCRINYQALREYRALRRMRVRVP